MVKLRDEQRSIVLTCIQFISRTIGVIWVWGDHLWWDLEFCTQEKTIQTFFHHFTKKVIQCTFIRYLTAQVRLCIFKGIKYEQVTMRHVKVCVREVLMGHESGTNKNP